jgi:hypothetical protein
VSQIYWGAICGDSDDDTGERFCGAARTKQSDITHHRSVAYVSCEPVKRPLGLQKGQARLCPQAPTPSSHADLQGTTSLPVLYFHLCPARNPNVDKVMVFGGWRGQQQQGIFVTRTRDNCSIGCVGPVSDAHSNRGTVLSLFSTEK